MSSTPVSLTDPVARLDATHTVGRVTCAAAVGAEMLALLAYFNVARLLLT